MSLLLQATQPAVGGWTPEGVATVIAALGGLIAGLTGLVVALRGLLQAKDAKSDAKAADVKAETAKEVATIANDRAGNNARAITGTQETVTKITAAMPSQVWAQPPESFPPPRD